MISIKRFASLLLLSAAFLTLPAFAIDLEQAKREGLVGERADGDLGLVVEQAPADVVSLVSDINERRLVEYRRIATANGISLAEVQALAGKKAIERTRPGDWIMTSDGWRQK